MPHPKVKISDNSGNEVAVTNNALDVNIAGGATIDIGDVDMFLDGGTALLGGAGAVASGVLRVTLASDDPAVAHLSEIESAIENLELCIGVDGAGGPTRCLSIAGTVLGGVIQEIAVDSTGNLQVDIVTAPSIAVTNAGTFATQIDGSALTALEKIDDIQDAIGTDGATGPSKCISIGGTDGSTLREIEVDSSGRLKVDVEVFSPSATGAAASVMKVDSESYQTGNIGIMPKVVCSTTLGALTNVGDGEITSLQVNGDGALYVEVAASTALTVDLGSDNDVTVTSGSVGHDITGMVSDTDVDVGITAEKIHTDADVAIKRIDIQAHPDNTGYIFVGDSGVAGNGSGGGIRLAAGDFYSLDIDNTGDVYVASSVADEDVSYIYYT